MGVCVGGGVGEVGLLYGMLLSHYRDLEFETPVFDINI